MLKQVLEHICKQTVSYSYRDFLYQKSVVICPCLAWREKYNSNLWKAVGCHRISKALMTIFNNILKFKSKVMMFQLTEVNISHLLYINLIDCAQSQVKIILFPGRLQNIN